MNNSTHSLAVRVEAKASGPDALDAVLRLVEIDRPKPSRGLCGRRGPKLRRQSKRRKGDAG